MSKAYPYIKGTLEGLTMGQLTLICIVLCIPAFLLHLDTIAFIGDEGIRSLVAFEMKQSGDFIVPTLNGEPYYNKPPLYNWLIVGLSEIFGYYGEWPARTTTLLCLAAFAVTVYIFTRRQFDRLTALTMAMMLLTSGRILFWDSMLGLIDICFSWIIYLNFMILYSCSTAGRWKQLFFYSYLLFSVAFLLKGLPAVVFQGISVITTLILHQQLKQKFFSRDHILGALAGSLPIVVYYLLYASKVNLDQVFGILFDQSMQRTPTHHGVGETLRHILTFPGEQVYHFLPWSLLVFMAFHQKARRWINNHPFVRFNFWMLVANLPVYWVSAQVFPRYLIMFIPLFNITGYYLVTMDRQGKGHFWKGLRIVFLIMAGLVMIACLFLPLAPQVREIPFLMPLWIVASLLMGLGFMGLLSDKERSFLWLAICLLVVRIVFDMVVLPLRSHGHAVNEIRADCRRVADAHPGTTWFLFGETFPHEVARFYTSAYTGQIIRKTNEIVDADALYLVDRKKYPDFPGVVVDSVRTEMKQVLALMKPQ